MKLNKDKVAVLYGYKQLQFGFYNGGHAFMAVDGELVNAREEAVKHGMTQSNADALSIREIIKWFVYKYCQ